MVEPLFQNSNITPVDLVNLTMNALQLLALFAIYLSLRHALSEITAAINAALLIEIPAKRYAG